MVQKKAKKVIAVIISLLLLMGTVTGINVSAAENTDYNSDYDVNADGVVSISDATEVQMYVAKFKSDVEFDIDRADIDKDGKITIVDATYLQLYVAKFDVVVQVPTENTTAVTSTSPSEPTTVPETTQVIVTEPTLDTPITAPNTEPTTEVTIPSTVETEPTVSTSEPISVPVTEPTTIVPSTEPTTAVPTTPSTEPTTVRPTVNVTDIQLNTDDLKLGVGEMYQLSFTCEADSEEFEYTYSSADNNIVTVNNEGVIEAVSEGETTISITAENGISDTCVISVLPMADSIKLNKSKIILGIGETFDFIDTIPDGSYAHYKEYMSDNSDIAEITIDDGIVTAKAEGTTNIRCKLSNGFEAVCEVVVLPLAESIELNANNLTMGIGETFDINNTIPSGTATFYRIYYIDDESIVDVQQGTGIATAKKAGTTKVRCRITSGYEALCTITVKNAPTKVTLSASTLNLKVGQNNTLKATVNSGAYSNKNTWTSSNNYIVKVNSNGTVQPMSQGTATITVKTYNGKTATCKVTVAKSVIKCLDVSTWQGEIDFKKVKSAGYNYVLIRAGYGDESSQKDDYFERNYKNAKEAGLKIGVYWFSYSTSQSNSTLEAKACLSCLKGKELDMPVFYDIEYEPQLHYSSSKLCGMAKNFCSYIESNSDFRAGVYAAYSTYDWNLFRDKIGDYYYWIAKVDGEQGSPLDYDIHQYTWTGKVNGISGNVDISYIYNLNVVQ